MLTTYKIATFAKPQNVTGKSMTTVQTWHRKLAQNKKNHLRLLEMPETPNYYFSGLRISYIWSMLNDESQLPGLETLFFRR